MDEININETLNAQGLQMLKKLLNEEIIWCFNENFVKITTLEIIQPLCQKMSKYLSPKSIRLSGSSATKIVCKSKKGKNIRANDIDINIYVVSTILFSKIEKYRTDVLINILKSKLHHIDQKYFTRNFIDKYGFLDMVTVHNDDDRWMLFSIGNFDRSMKIDIKIINYISRSYIFSIDSFEITLDNIVFGRENDENIICKWGDIDKAMYHAIHKSLVIPEPGNIRNGLLRYCLMLCKGYKIKDRIKRNSVEQVLVVKFFIDFCGVEKLKNSIQKLTKNGDFFEIFNLYFHRIVSKHSSLIFDLHD